MGDSNEQNKPFFDAPNGFAANCYAGFFASLHYNTHAICSP
jgi:hypothetical protein